MGFKSREVLDAEAEKDEQLIYNLIPTIKAFHESDAKYRCIVGPVGSGKTTGATYEIFYYLPHFLNNEYGIKKTRWVIVRNTYSELIDTTQKTVFEWFDFGVYKKQEKVYTLNYPEHRIQAEYLFRSCDNPDDVKKFKSLEVTGYWIDESIEVADEVKLMLKNRIGRYPRKSPVKFGIETTNPPDVEHTTYSQFKWNTAPPGPIPSGQPLDDHVGFWQPAYENVDNLGANYYEDLRKSYADNPDWVEMYIEGKPGQLIRGKLVYQNFNRDIHVALKPLKWSGQLLYRGWDNSGNTPAAVVVCPVSANTLHIFKEFTTVKENIVDFTNRVVTECNQIFPNGRYMDYGDPAGEATYSTREGDFTSNRKLMEDECGVTVVPGEQNFKTRVNSVDQALLRRNGVLIDPSCIRLINGFLGGYHYQELHNMPGTFKKDPAKNKYSHCFVGSTPILTEKGEIPIKDIRVGDKVVTPIGLKKVTATMNSWSEDLIKLEFSNGKSLTCTKDHPFIINGRQVEADALQYGEVLTSINNKKETEKWVDQHNMKSKNSTELSTTEKQKDIIKRILTFLNVPSICIEKFGRVITGISQKGIASITETATERITESKIWISCRPVSMQLSTGGRGPRAEIMLTPENTCLKLLSRPLLNGIEVQKELLGTKSMEKEPGRIENLKSISVSSVKRNTRFLEVLRKKASALRHAKVSSGGSLGSMIWSFCAKFVELLLPKTNMLGKRPAQENALTSPTAEVKLVKKSSVEGTFRVYDLTVEDAHCFFSNAVLAGNCHDALQYVCTKLYVSATMDYSEADIYPDEDIEATY